MATPKRPRATACALLAGLTPRLAAAGTITVLHHFGSVPNDGYYPDTSLVPAPAGALIGGTEQGNYGGTIFSITPGGTYKILHEFNGRDGAIIEDRVIRTASGDLYGTTLEGGAHNHGVAYRLSPGGAFSILYNFGATKTDASLPYGDLIPGADGAFYGTTGYGGRYGFGTIFRLTAGGQESVVYSFQGRADGNYPDAGLVADRAGNLYGVTYSGGTGRAGTIFQFTRAGQLVVLHAFANGDDGAYPQSAMIIDPAGNLFGVAAQSREAGTIYRVSATGRFTTLYQFTGGTDGAFPLSRLLRDSAGNLYGTTAAGGTEQAGTVFRLAPNGTLTTLNNLSVLIGNAEPRAGVTADAAGNLYGTSAGSYASNGAVFRLAPH